MNKDIQEIESRLKDVVKKNEDSIIGFEKAVDNAKQMGTKSYFSKRVEERKRFIKQLRNATPALELGNTKIEGSKKGVVHRSWMDVKALFSEDNDEAMLKEAVRGDKAAIEEYDEVIAHTMVPHRVKEILREQKEMIENDLETSEILASFK